LTAALIVVACVVMARWSRESRDMAAADVS
jgi:hypothetical protein